MRRSAFTNAELERKAADYRGLLKTSYQLTPLYIATQIDRLPSTVHDDILHLRNGRGKTWEEIEALSAEPVKLEDGSKGPGFIDWPALPFEVLQLFPDMRLPKSSLHRWYDLRVDQVRKDVLVRSAQARTVAESSFEELVDRRIETGFTDEETTHV